jgi:hypothetical protein
VSITPDLQQRVGNQGIQEIFYHDKKRKEKGD